MNVATYLFTALAARLLGPQDYGAFASLMAVLLVVSVLQLGIQATAARRISADPEHVGQIEREILPLTSARGPGRRAACCCWPPRRSTGCCSLDSLRQPRLLALAAVPLTISGGQLGVLQGERRWWPVAVIYLASGVPRLVVGTALILWRPDELTAMVGVLIGSASRSSLGVYALRRNRDAGRVSRAPLDAGRSSGRSSPTPRRCWPSWR